MHPTSFTRLAEPRSIRKAAEEPRSVVIEAPVEDYNSPAAITMRRARLMSRVQRAALAAYVICVAVGCFAFQFWGCLCHDPDHGNSNEWNRIDGVHACDGFPVPRLIGVSYCIAVTGITAVHLYFTLPAIVWISRYYTKRLALATLVKGIAVGVIFCMVLLVGAVGKDIQPGLGFEGVPIGSAVTSGFGAWLFVCAASFVGYWHNARLGMTLTTFSTYLVASAAVGVLVAFHAHLGLGIALFLDMIFVSLWAAQVFLTSGSTQLTILAYLAPYAVGALIGVPLEFLDFGMPPGAGYGVGLGVVFLACVALSQAYDAYGVDAAQRLTGMLLIQDLIGLASAIAGYQLHWSAGAVMAFALEIVLASTIDVVVREGNQFGMWTLISPIVEALLFAMLLVFVFSVLWPVAMAVSMAGAFVTGLASWAGFRRYGVIGGMRAIFLSMLTYMQATLAMLELTVVRMPTAVAAPFAIVTYVLLLSACAFGLRRDDGSGRLYGSGIEVISFIMLAQAEAFALAIFLYTVLSAPPSEAHLSGFVFGSLLLATPSLCQILAGTAANAHRNFRRGLYVALWLQMVWFATVLGLHLAVDVALPVAIHLANGYAFGFVLMACFAIRRYLSALLATYVIFLFTSLGAIFLIYIHRLPFTPIVSIVVLTCAGLYGPILLVQPLARQHADAVENALLDKQAKDLWHGEMTRAAAKAAKPTDPRKKHLDKLRRLMKGPLPKLVDLSHNGVMERAGVVRWCFAESDGRPILPFTTQLLVARGSFLYLFAPEGELLPSTRALSAICLFGATFLKIDQYQDERLPLLNHLIAIRLSMVWQKRHMIYLQMRSAAQMHAWLNDLRRRAEEDSSTSAFRLMTYTQSHEPDPSLAEGMLAVRRDMARAATEAERLALVKGIGGNHQSASRPSSSLAADAGGACRRATDSSGAERQPPRGGASASDGAGATSQTACQPTKRFDGSDALEALGSGLGAGVVAGLACRILGDDGAGVDSAEVLALDGLDMGIDDADEAAAGGDAKRRRSQLQYVGTGNSSDSSCAALRRQRRGDEMGDPLSQGGGASAVQRRIQQSSTTSDQKRTSTRIGAAVARSRDHTYEQELTATKVFDSVVMYTPRGVHGGGDDVRSIYPVQKSRYPSLAQSAREAAEANERADEEARRRRRDWLAGKSSAS